MIAGIENRQFFVNIRKLDCVRGSTSDGFKVKHVSFVGGFAKASVPGQTDVLIGVLVMRRSVRQSCVVIHF